MTTTAPATTEDHMNDERDNEKTTPTSEPRKPATLSIRTSTAILSAVIVGLVVALAVTGGMLWSAKSDLRDQDTKTADNQHAEQVATDYAVGASNIDYQDADAWLVRLKANTTPELANKFDATAPKLQELLIPLQWTSSATPIDATIESETGGIYTVNVFLNVTSTSAQTPNGAQTTVTYNVTLDRNNDWKITDVGGMDGALPGK